MLVDRTVERNRDLRPFRVAGWLVGTATVQTGDFTFNSGLKSPMKIESDVLRRPEFAGTHEEIAEDLADLIREKGVKPDVVVGVLTGADSFTRRVADFLGCEAAARLGNTDTPEKRQLVHGEIIPGQRVVIVEDAFTTGGNTFSTKKQVEAEGGEVVLAVSIFDYGFPVADRNFEAAGLPRASLTKLNDVISVLHATKHDGLVLRLREWRDHTVPEFFARQG